MDREARHVVASRGGNRHGYGVPGFLWRISKRAERPELAPEEKLRLPKVSILFPYGSVTRSLSLSLYLSPFSLCIFSFHLSFFRLIALLYDFCPARSLVSSFITLCLLLCLSLLSCLALSLSSVSKLFLASRPSSFPPFPPSLPREILFAHLHLPIYALVYSRSLVPFAPSLIYPFNLSVFLLLYDLIHLFFSLFFSVSLRNRFLLRATDKPFSVSRCTVHLSGIA